VNLFYLSDQGDIIQANLTCAQLQHWIHRHYLDQRTISRQCILGSGSRLRRPLLHMACLLLRHFRLSIGVGWRQCWDQRMDFERSWRQGITWLEHSCCTATPYGLNVFYVDSFSQLLVSTVYQTGVGWGTRKFAFQFSVSYFLYFVPCSFFWASLRKEQFRCAL
jgi:hypothetical protein